MSTRALIGSEDFNPLCCESYTNVLISDDTPIVWSWFSDIVRGN